MGAYVESLIVYENKPNVKSDKKKISEQLKSDQIDFLTFFSPSAFDAFLVLLSEDVIAEIINKKIALAVIGPSTAQAVKMYNLPVAVLSKKSTEEDLIQGIITYIKSQNGVSINA